MTPHEVTVMSAVPSEPAGVMNMMDPGLTELTEDFPPPTVTVVEPLSGSQKPLPVKVTA